MKIAEESKIHIPEDKIKENIDWLKSQGFQKTDKGYELFLEDNNARVIVTIDETYRAFGYVGNALVSESDGEYDNAIPTAGKVLAETLLYAINHKEA